MTFRICDFVEKCVEFLIHYVIFTCLLSNTTFCKAVLDRFNANLLTLTLTFQAFAIHAIAWRMSMLFAISETNKSSFICAITIHINFFRYFVLKLWMILASSGCKPNVFFVRKTIFLLLYMSISEVGWTVALSNTKITFLLFLLIWKLRVSRTFSIISTYIQDLESSK